MNIAFYGSSLLSSYWNGAATYYRGILRALGERGYDITFYEPDAFDRQQHRDYRGDEHHWIADQLPRVELAERIADRGHDQVGGGHGDAGLHGHVET